MNALTAYITQKDAERDLHYCPCCRDRYPSEDMDLANDWLHSEAMRARYGAACCKQCTDDHILTADAVVMPKADAVWDGYDDIDAAIAADRRERPMREAVANEAGKRDAKP